MRILGRAAGKMIGTPGGADDRWAGGRSGARSTVAVSRDAPAERVTSTSPGAGCGPEVGRPKEKRRSPPAAAGRGRLAPGVVAAVVVVVVPGRRGRGRRVGRAAAGVVRVGRRHPDRV